MYNLLKVLFEVALLICFARGQGDYLDNFCYTPKQEEGQCVSLLQCEELKPLILKPREILLQYHCGWEDKDPKVCCLSPAITTTTTTATASPIPAITTTTITATASPIPTNKCVTPERKLGSCVPLRVCKHIIKILATRTELSLAYVKISRCTSPYPDEIYVCCDSNQSPRSRMIWNNSTRYSQTTTPSNSKNDACPESAIPSNSKSQCCGKQNYSKTKIFNGNETAVDQYPWLTLLEYSLPSYLCGGSLISNKYVLTAAHCVLNEAKKPQGLVAVVLGEYNITNKGKDCTPADGGGEDCTTGAVRVPVESAIAHPKYNTRKITIYSNDIALLRLSGTVTFNDFIKPICLPSSDITNDPTIDIKFVVAGWGAASVTRPRSEVKLYASLTHVKHEQCHMDLHTPQSSVWKRQICAGGELKQGTCNGDSGGPLMYENEYIHEVVGVASFGFNQCGIHKPNVFTKVYDYLSWINSNIKS